MKVILEGTTEGHGGDRVRKEFNIESFTSIGGQYLLLDEDGDGRLMLTADELAEIGGVAQ